MTGKAHRRQLAATIVVGLSSLVLGAPHAPAQISGRFPTTGSNVAIVIQYSMTGVAASGAPKDNGPSMQWHRRIQGRVTGRRIGLSATVSLTQPGYPRCNTGGGGFYFTVEARVSAGHERATFVHPKSGQCRDATFPVTVNLAVDVPEDATEAGISVRATYVNPMYGDRVSLVYGEFSATPTAGAGAAPVTRPRPRVPRATSGGDGGGPGDTGGDEVPPWKIAVGAAAAAAAIAAVARTLASRRAKKPSRPPQYGYVLQLSAKVVEVEWGVPASLTVTAWRVDEQGGHSLASDVPITISTPDSAVVIQPRSGTGTLTCQLSLDGQPRARTVELEVTAQGGGRTITANVTAKVGFGVEVAVHFEPAAGRTHKGIAFDRPNQLAADGEDVLKAVIYVRVKGKSPEEVTRSKIRPSLDPDGEDFDLRVDPTCDEPDKVPVLIRSRRLLLHTADPPPAVTLRIAATAVTRGGYDVELPAVTVPLEPRRIYLKLWVIPGRRPGTSEAGAFACLAPSAASVYPGLRLRLKVEGGAGASLRPRGGGDAPTDSRGLASWDLEYHGLTWANMDAAGFKVKVAAVTSTGTTEATSVAFNVGQNIRRMVEAIHAARASLQVDNPFFQSPDWAYIPMTATIDRVTRGRLRGPYWNARLSLLELAGGADSTTNPFVCQRLRDRIYEWMQARRHGVAHADPETVASMNGIEVSQYAINPVHVFAGFHLSGSQPCDDPRAIDPWWLQEWGELLTWNEEVVRCVAALGPLSCLLLLLLSRIGIVGKALGTTRNLLFGTRARTLLVGTPITVGTKRLLAGVDNPGVVDGGYTGYRNLITDAVVQWTQGTRRVGAITPVEPW